MRLFTYSILLVALIAYSTASVIPATPTYAIAAGPGIVTAQSDQVFARNHNRLYITPPVPAYVPTVSTPHPYPFYPSYSYATTTYPYTPNVYRYGGYPYGGYYPGYGYGGYGYTTGTTVW